MYLQTLVATSLSLATQRTGPNVDCHTAGRESVVRHFWAADNAL